MKRRGAITEHGLGWLVITIPIVISAVFLGLLVSKLLTVPTERDTTTPGINDFETLIAEVKDLGDVEIITIPIEDQGYILSTYPGSNAPKNCRDITCICLNDNKCERFPKLDTKEHTISIIRPDDIKEIITSITICKNDKNIAIGLDEKECNSYLT